MKKSLISQSISSVAVALTVALAPVVQADNAVTPTPGVEGPAVACDFGSCFVPSFDAVGAINEYRGPGAEGVVRAEYADCCVPGDKYRVEVLGASSNTTHNFTSIGPLNGDCSTGPYLDSQAVEVRGAKRVKYKAVALPGGVPASAYLRVMQGGWVQTAGAESCFFDE